MLRAAESTEAETAEPAESTESAAAETPAPAPETEIRVLSADEFADIRQNYNDSVHSHYVGTDRVEGNRPSTSVVKSEIYAGIPNVRCFGPDTETPTVYLTYNCTTEYAPNTELVLNYLAEQNAHAIFFIDRSYADKNQDLIRRMIAEGHEIASLGGSLPDGGQQPSSDNLTKLVKRGL